MVNINQKRKPCSEKERGLRLFYGRLTPSCTNPQHGYNVPVIAHHSFQKHKKQTGQSPWPSPIISKQDWLTHAVGSTALQTNQPLRSSWHKFSYYLQVKPKLTWTFIPNQHATPKPTTFYYNGLQAHKLIT